MNRLFLVLLLLPVIATQNAKAQGWEWARSVTAYESEAYCCSSDQSGHFYVAGDHWGGSATFGAYTISGPPYLVKYDTTGNVLWAIAATGGGTAGFLGVTNDMYNNEYIIGSYSATITFGGYTLAIPGPTAYYLFITKVDSAGNVKWIKNIGNTFSWELVGGTSWIKTDNAGNIYLTSSFSNNPTIGGITLTNAATDSTTDILIAKFDSSGTVLWAKGYGGPGWEFPSGITLTPTNQIYVDGYFNNDTFNFGTTTIGSAGNASAGFLALLDSDGNAVWAKEIDSTQLTGLTSDAAGDVFITGVYGNSQPDLGSFILPRAPESSSYGLLAKYNLSGSLEWAKPMQGNFVIPWTATLDPCDNVWVISDMGSGHATTNDTIDGHILAPLTVNNEPNFIACWSNSGTFITAVAMPSGSTDDPNSIVTDGCGNIYIAAEQEGLDTFILGPDTIIHGGENMFFAKYSPNLGCGSCSIVGIAPITGHTSFCLEFADTLSDATPGGLWSSSNTAIATVGSITGIVSGVSLGVVTITYTVGSSYVTFTDTVKLCEGGVSPVNRSSIQMMIYPNPATALITISTSDRISTVVITNLLGQIVYSNQYYSQKVQVDVTVMPAGVYFLKVNGTEVRKFVKQ